MNAKRPIPEDGRIIWNVQPDITVHELAQLQMANGSAWGIALLPPECKRHLSLPPIDWSPPKPKRNWLMFGLVYGPDQWDYDRAQNLQKTRRLHPELESKP